MNKEATIRVLAQIFGQHGDNLTTTKPAEKACAKLQTPSGHSIGKSSSRFRDGPSASMLRNPFPRRERSGLGFLKWNREKIRQRRTEPKIESFGDHECFLGQYSQLGYLEPSTTGGGARSNMEPSILMSYKQHTQVGKVVNGDHGLTLPCLPRSSAEAEDARSTSPILTAPLEVTSTTPSNWENIGEGESPVLSRILQPPPHYTVDAILREAKEESYPSGLHVGDSILSGLKGQSSSKSPTTSELNDHESLNSVSPASPSSSEKCSSHALKPQLSYVPGLKDMHSVIMP